MNPFRYKSPWKQVLDQALSASGADVVRDDRGGYVIGLAVEARLLGRFRILTLDAAVDVLDRRPPERRDRSETRFLRVVSGHARPEPALMVPPVLKENRRRGDAEAVLHDAERTLGAIQFSADGRPDPSSTLRKREGGGDA